MVFDKKYLDLTNAEVFVFINNEKNQKIAL